MSTSANKHVLLALGSDRIGMDDVQGRDQSGWSRTFICVKPCETNVQRMLYSML